MNWIISELKTVKDPDLIQGFKQLLTYGRKKEVESGWDAISDEEKREIVEGIAQVEKAIFLHMMRLCRICENGMVVVNLELNAVATP